MEVKSMLVAIAAATLLAPTVVTARDDDHGRLVTHHESKRDDDGGRKFRRLQRQINQLRATIEALLETGVQGPPGPAGPPGPSGAPASLPFAGAACPVDMFVTGFSAAGNMICSDGVQTVEVFPPPPPLTPPGAPVLTDVVGPTFGGVPAGLIDRFAPLLTQAGLGNDTECMLVGNLGLTCNVLFERLFLDLGLDTLRRYQVTGVAGANAVVALYESADCSGEAAGFAAGIRSHIDAHLLANGPSVVLDAIAQLVGAPTDQLVNLIAALNVFELDQRLQAGADGSFAATVVVSDEALSLSANAKFVTPDNASPDSACSNGVALP